MKKVAFLFILFSTLLLHAQQVALTEIPALKQLPVNAIHRIFQDSEGFIWYGTVNGLCRDDGYRIQVFRSDFNHPNMISNNLIECITEDAHGRIWFGTDKGAYILDKKDYTVRRIDHPKTNDRLVAQIYSTTDGHIWLSTEGTLLRFNDQGSCIKEYATYHEHTPSILSGFCESRKGDILISVSKGLIYRLDAKTDRFVPYPDVMKEHNPGFILQDKDHDYFWVCTWGDGLMRFDPSAARDSMFVYQTEVEPKNENLMYAVLDTEHNHIWATSVSHLVAFEIQDGTARLCREYDNLPGNAMLNEIIRNHNGDFWISAFDRPSLILHNRNDRPQTYALQALQERCHYRPAIMALCDGGDGMMWLFQERENLFLYDLKHDRASDHKQFPSTAGLPFSIVKLITGSRMKNAVWVVPEHKLQGYRITRKGMDMLFTDSVDFTSCTVHDAITALYEDRQGVFLYAGTQKGLFRCDLHNGHVTAVCDTMGHVTDIIEAENHTLYICTYNKGVYALSPQGKPHRYPLTQAFSCLTRTSDGMLWLGSSEGDLMSLNPHDGSTKSYNGTCQLNGDMINKVVADEFNHIWIDTNQKIIEFNPHNGSYRTYPTTDGSAGLWRLIPTALCKGEDGNLYFGGIPGISRFTPSNALEREASPAQVVITDLRIGNRSLFFDLHRTYNSHGEFELLAHERNLTVCFSSLNHRVAHKILYAYRMKGIDRQWQYTSGESAQAVYNHLPKGCHEFEIKATDENGQWSRTTATLTVRCLPAWYETWWAYLIYIGVVLGFAGWGFYLYIHRMQRRNDELWADSAEMLRMRNYLKLTHENENEDTETLSSILMDKAVRIVEENLSEPDFDVQRLAEAMNMSRSTLTRKLKSISGDTPLDFIRHIKMKHACRMLRNKDMNVSEVAAALGYFNRKYFTTCFKDEFGMTPSEYQKKNSEE